MRSIRQVKNKAGNTKYEATVMVHGRRQFRRFDKLREAEAWISEIRFKRDQHIDTYQRLITIDMLFQSYLDFAENKGRSPGTIAKAKIYFRLYLKPFYGDNDVQIMTIEDHEFFLGKLRGFHLGPASINRIRSLLCIMYNVAIRKRRFNGVISKNPFVCIEKMDEQESRPDIQYWGKPEIDRFLGHARGTGLYSLWVALLNTGLRIGEAIALDVCQVDRNAHVLHVSRTWCRTSKAIKNKPKNGKRMVPLSHAVQEVLYPLISGRSHGLVWTGLKGNALDFSYLAHTTLPKLCEEAQVKKIGLHGFRHTFATLYMQNGGNITDLQYILGHSTPKLTNDYYVHFSKEHISRRANVVSVGGGNVVQVDFKKVV